MPPERQTAGDTLIKKLLRDEVILIFDVANAPRNHASSSFFPIPKPNSPGEWRAIADLSDVSDFIAAPKFRLETLRDAADLVTPGCFMSSVDLKSAYYHIPMSESSSKMYTSFSWGDNQFRWRGLPMGVSAAPWAFTKFTKPFMSLLRARGIRCILYLDDLLICADTVAECERQTVEAVATISALGFLISSTKSMLDPAQHIKYLGFIISSTDMTFSLPTDKRRGALRRVRAMKRMVEKGDTPSLQELASLLGVLNSLSTAVPLTRRYSAALQRCKHAALAAGASYPFGKTVITAEAVAEIETWIEILAHPSLCAAPINPPPPSRVLTTDASFKGHGGAVFTAPPNVPSSWCPDPRALNASEPIATSAGRWPSHIINNATSINELEARTVPLTLRSLRTELRGHNVLLLCDNASTVAYLRRQRGRVARLSRIAEETHDVIREIGITAFRAVHTAGATNLLADRLSRAKHDPNDYKLSADLFSAAADRWGKPTVDLFAAHHNAQVSRYVAAARDPFAWRIDAFRLDWGTLGLTYANPPFALAGRVLAKVRAERARMIVVLPEWASWPWRPLLVSMTIAHETISKGEKIFTTGSNTAEVAGPTRWNTRIALIDGSTVNPRRRHTRMSAAKRH
jgi:hypothetical protein